MQLKKLFMSLTVYLLVGCEIRNWFHKEIGNPIHLPHKIY